MNDAPEKLYYSISEVSDATGVKAHVLRYWESQFPMLRPRKSRGGMRMYRAKDAAIIQRIKYLLYDRGFTIAGARRKLFEDRRSGISYDTFEPDAREASFSIREEMREARQGEELEPRDGLAPAARDEAGQTEPRPVASTAADAGARPVSSGLTEPPASLSAAAAAPGASAEAGSSAAPGGASAGAGSSAAPGGASPRQLEFGNGAPAPDVAPAAATAATPGATLQEIRAEIEVLQAMLMAPPRLKIRT